MPPRPWQSPLFLPFVFPLLFLIENAVFFHNPNRPLILNPIPLLLTGDNGTLSFWDWNSGTPFQTLDDIPQPGSLEAEAGVFCSTFDQTGTRLITGCADKTIKAGLPYIFFRFIPDFSFSIFLYTYSFLIYEVPPCFVQ